MSKQIKAPWDDRLMCHVVSLAYDFRSHMGQVYMLDGNCCDMTGCLSLFQGIDPKVTAIETYSGDKADTVYRKEDEEWSAFVSKS